MGLPFVVVDHDVDLNQVDHRFRNEVIGGEEPDVLHDAAVLEVDGEAGEVGSPAGWGRATGCARAAGFNVAASRSLR